MKACLLYTSISPPELRIPDNIRDDVLIANNVPFEEVGNLDDALGQLDILYMTRVQKERFFNEEDYIRLKDCYILDKKKMKLAKEDMYVLHPLPRVNEISVEVDDDPRAAYFKQAQYGVYAVSYTHLDVYKRQPPVYPLQKCFPHCFLNCRIQINFLHLTR